MKSATFKAQNLVITQKRPLTTVQDMINKAFLSLKMTVVSGTLLTFLYCLYYGNVLM